MERQKSSGPAAKLPAEKVVRDIRRATRKHHSAEDKIRIVLEGLRGEESIASLCRLLKAHDPIASPAFIVVKAADEFHTKTTAPNQLWQTDFTYLKVIGWGWFYLSTVLDEFSRYIIAWKLCTSMAARDVTDTLEMALTASGCSQVRARHRRACCPTTGPATSPVSWRSGWPRAPLTMSAARRATRRHKARSSAGTQTLKNRILLENYYLPGDLEAQVEAFVTHYNNQRYHESLRNLTPADVYFGRGPTILLERERIKRQTIQLRRLIQQQHAA